MNGPAPPDTARPDALDASDCQCLTVKQVASLLACSPRAVWRDSALGAVGLSTFPAPLRLSGKRTRWLRRDIAAYLAALGGKEGPR